MAGNIIVVGSNNMDLVVRAPCHPQPETPLLAPSLLRSPKANQPMMQRDGATPPGRWQS